MLPKIIEVLKSATDCCHQWCQGLESRPDWTQLCHQCTTKWEVHITAQGLLSPKWPILCRVGC